MVLRILPEWFRMNKLSNNSVRKLEIFQQGLQLSCFPSLSRVFQTEGTRKLLDYKSCHKTIAGDVLALSLQCITLDS